MKIYVDKNALQDYTTKLIAKEKTIFATKNEVGSPLVASTVAEMTDHDKIYVYVGSETGYTSGNWYYWDGTAWTSGGIYNSEGFVLDDTLTSATLPAQAKAVGDKVNQLSDDVSNIEDITITESVGAAINYTDNEEGVRWRHISTGWQKTQTTGTASSHAVTYPVTAGRTYRVTGRHNAYTPLATFWTDSSVEPVGCSQDGYSADQANEYVTLDVVIPQGVTYMIVNSFPLDTFPTVNIIEETDTGVLKANELSESVDYRISGNLFDIDNYTLLADESGYYYISSTPVQGKARGTINYSSGDSVRLIAVPCDECKKYMIRKSVPSVMRVTSGALEWPRYASSGVTFSNYDQNSGSNTEPLFIETRPGDNYLYIQLFSNSDSDQTLSDYLPGLTVYEVANAISSEAVGFVEKRKLLEPYAFGSLNQVARLGWGTTISNAPPVQSIPSYKLALQNGVKIMLADIEVTADGKFVCFHDQSLNGSRVYIIDNGVPRPIVDGDPAMTVAGSTLAEIDANRDFGAYKGAAYEGMKILRLEEFLKWCANTNCVPFLENKVQWTSAQITEISDIVRKYHLDDYCIIEENVTSAQPLLWHNALPKCKYVIGGGTAYSDAITQAIGLISAGHDSSGVFVGITNPENLTAEQLALVRSNGIHLWYTEIQSYSDFDSLMNSGYFEYYTLFSCSVFNLFDYMYTKI